MKISALFVARGGAYYGLPDVDPWDENRDARTFSGPGPVVAHPPCARWCRMAGMVERVYGIPQGQDFGTFAAALQAVNRWGGVLEHPAWSKAWDAYGLRKPDPAGGWSRGLFDLGLVCQVEQGHYGHRARKATWLYLVGHPAPPPLRWGPSIAPSWCGGCRNRGEGPKDARGLWSRLSARERSATPPAFRDLLLALARGTVDLSSKG